MVGFVAYGAVSAIMPLIGGLVPISAVLDVVNDEVLGLLRTVAVAGLVMAAADYVIVRRRMGKKTRMSKHEVKQENKQTEGDPLLKGAIRSRQLAASRNRMMADVPTADVVLVNPTHVAVALRTTPSAARPAWWPAAPAWSPSASASRPPSTACPWSGTSRWPAPCTARRRSARRSRPSSTQRSRRSWPS